MEERTKQLLSLGREHYEKRAFEKAEHYLRQVLERESDISFQIFLDNVLQENCR